MRALRAATRPPYLVLGLIVGVGLALRLANNDYGLPYVYNYDEASHFTDRAVAMFAQGTFNPGYFQNPAAFTYLVHAALRLLYGDLLPSGPLYELPLGSIVRQFALDPTPIWRTARSLSALLCMAGVVSVFFVGRRLWGVREGLVAAAVLSFAFLPVVYSRIALTDVGTLLPVALAVFGAVRVYEGGGARSYVLAGAATGLAIAFKYTTGLVLLPLLVAGFLRIRRESGALRARPAVRSTALALLAAGAVFFITNPYFFLELRRAAYGLLVQAEAAGGTKKLGQEQSSGFLYYLESLTWGLGWAAALLAVAGAVLEFRRDRMRAVLIALFPAVFFLYLALQSRFFGRWLLPLYPLLALFCAVALVRLVDLLRSLPLGGGGPALRAGALALVTLAVLAQPLAADVRTASLLGREDTRNAARAFLVASTRPNLRTAIEPAVPDLYFRLSKPAGRDGRLPDTCTGLRKLAPAHGGALEPASCLPVDERQFVRGFVKDMRESTTTTDRTGMTAYAATLRPATIDQFRRKGFCHVMTMSVIRGRLENAGDPDALAYYDRLERESRVIFRADPYGPGARPVPFHFDLSYNYYPTEYERPGPEVEIFRLDRCRQRYGIVPQHPVAGDGLMKAIGTSFEGFEDTDPAESSQSASPESSPEAGSAAGAPVGG